MRTFQILAIGLIVMLLAGCGAAKFAEEKTLLTAVTKAMETFTSAINAADAPPAIASALGAFTGQIEELVPAMKKLTEEHPEWETDPPDELKDTMEKFKSAATGLQGTMPKLMQMANEHADNEELQGALRKFQEVMSGL